MNEREMKKQRRHQFGLRKALLWTTAAALGLGILSALEWDPASRVVYPCWIAVVLILRWIFGSRVAALVSVVAGLLLFASLLGLIWVAHERNPVPVEVIMISFVGGILGGFIGFLLFLLVEAACRTVDWLDRIGQRGE